MDNGQTPTLPEATPAHEAGTWNVHRATLVQHSHEVDGVRYIGGAGHRLEDEIRATWVNEVRQLVTDLKIAMAYLPENVLRYAVSEINQAAEATIEMRGAVLEGVRAETDDHPAVVVDETPRRQGPRRRRDDAATALAEAGQAEEGAVTA